MYETKGAIYLFAVDGEGGVRKKATGVVETLDGLLAGDETARSRASSGAHGDGPKYFGAHAHAP